MVLKSTIFPEWYSDMVQPWLQYVHSSHSTPLPCLPSTFSFLSYCSSLSTNSRIEHHSSYVPISTDYKDLWTVMAFFKGDEKGKGNHDDVAKEIAMAGKEWAGKHW